MDDMLVKSKVVKDHMTHLGEMFSVLKRYKMKLNSLKCAFRVQSEKFLGFMVNQQGIKANPKKIKSFLDMSSPRKLKEVISLARKVIALSRFFSQVTNCCVPFFDVLRG